MTCGACVSGFLFDPLRMWLVIASFSISILALGFLTSAKQSKKKLAWLYAHLFFLAWVGGRRLNYRFP